jgi:hypothetical protein
VPGNAFLCILDIYFKIGSLLGRTEVIWPITYKVAGFLIQPDFPLEMSDAIDDGSAIGVVLVLNYTEDRSTFVFFTH